ncbi:MAG TPA: FtsX-like permease family protein [Candidatus Cloacimonetes bacterium]|nr:FtsX-like permease family protein [Candidatus Cloacimonadota bacterium]
MSIFYNIKLGIVDMVHNVGRTLITMLGVILGTMSIIAVLAIVQGGREQSIRWLEERGGVLKLSIDTKWTFDLDKRSQIYDQRLMLKDMRLIRNYFPDLLNFSPESSKWLQMKYKDKNYSTRVNGVFPAYQEADNFHIGEGRFITEFDIEQANRVIAIGVRVKDALFGKENALGRNITIRNSQFKVIGIMEEKKMEIAGWRGHNPMDWLNRQSFIPLTTMIKKLFADQSISEINFQVASAEMVKPTQERLSQFLKALRGGEEIFEVRANSDRLENIQKSSRDTQLILMIVGGISLIVGGIVITNISLASVKERLREIGVRMAVGAKRKDILVQFLIQTTFMSLLGGIVGVIMGLALLRALEKFLSSPTSANPNMIIIALVLSVGVGFVAGFFPAMQASRSDPIKILRYE